jgi:ubiquinone/menaquinone biosynthesis C-methylase UbiE
MIYTIEEVNFERQHLLSRVLETISLHALETISLPAGSTILDLGCGLGETTEMLSKRFPGTHLTGLDQNESLIQVAKETKIKPGSFMQFIAGNAQHLPFENNRFDFVFTRYLLHHIPDAITVLNEMKRVCKSGGIVFAQEPDINALQSYPENWAYPKMKEFVNLLFADALIGRKLINFFRKLQMKKIDLRSEVIYSEDSFIVKKFYRMTVEAMGSFFLMNKLVNEKQLEEMISECRRIELDPEVVVLSNPIIAVWGVKAI